VGFAARYEVFETKVSVCFLPAQYSEYFSAPLHRYLPIFIASKKHMKNDKPGPVGLLEKSSITSLTLKPTQETIRPQSHFYHFSPTLSHKHKPTKNVVFGCCEAGPTRKGKGYERAWSTSPKSRMIKNLQSFINLTLATSRTSYSATGTARPVYVMRR
jgi:hypothetical protein